MGDWVCKQVQRKHFLKFLQQILFSSFCVKSNNWLLSTDVGQACSIYWVIYRTVSRVSRRLPHMNLGLMFRHDRKRSQSFRWKVGDI